MSRKKYTKAEETTPSLLKFREKRKWQIALRRYVLQESQCAAYAPYFGLDIKSIRRWFECQFTGEMCWDSFGKNWQFDHIIPVAYFDFSKENELILCWNFINLRVESIQQNKGRGHRVDVLQSKKYFEELYQSTGNPLCKRFLEKIDTLELSEILSTAAQKSFLKENKEYLQQIENYSFFEFELLNSGRDLEEVKKEIEFLKNIGSPKQ